jgi:hypothetical protein
MPWPVTDHLFWGLPNSTTLKVPTNSVLFFQNYGYWKNYNIVGGGILVNPVANSEYGYTIGDGLYEEGGKSTATITAVAFSGYKFVSWTKNGVEISTDNPYSFTVTEDVELVANFESIVGIETSEFTAFKIYPNLVMKQHVDFQKIWRQ